MINSEIKKIVFSGDILRIENNDINRFKNPQAINIDWLRSLFEPLLKNVFQEAEAASFYEEEGRENSVRWEVFDSLDLPLDEVSWSSIYRDTKSVPKIVSKYIEDNFQNSVWITFEAPPYLVQALNNAGITFIDFTIHPVRFLPDYFFGVRSNDVDITKKLNKIRLDESVIYDFARISKSRTVRTFRKDVPKDSVIFLGQLASDSSLIVEDKMSDLNTVSNSLRDLTIIHDNVYYKAHPHAKNIDILKNMVESIPRCEWIDINIYDALGSRQFEYFATLSSGAHIEAGYFGKNSRRLLNNPILFDGSSDFGYVPVYACYLKQDFWNFLFADEAFDHAAYYPSAIEQALKMTLNMKWGR